MRCVCVPTFLKTESSKSSLVMNMGVWMMDSTMAFSARSSASVHSSSRSPSSISPRTTRPLRPILAYLDSTIQHTESLNSPSSLRRAVKVNQ
jgi:hypothetical protein